MAEFVVKIAAVKIERKIIFTPELGFIKMFSAIIHNACEEVLLGVHCRIIDMAKALLLTRMVKLTRMK